MTTSETYLFEINASERTEQTWRRNLTFHVVTTSVERAVELFRESHPRASVHKVERRNRTGTVIVDPRISTDVQVPDLGGEMRVVPGAPA